MPLQKTDDPPGPQVQITTAVAAYRGMLLAYSCMLPVEVAKGQGALHGGGAHGGGDDHLLPDQQTDVQRAQEHEDEDRQGRG